MTNPYSNRLILISFITLTSLFLIACGGGVSGDKNNFVVVEDQVVVDLNKITIAKTNIEQPVCLRVYESEIGGPSPLKTNVILAELTLTKGSEQNLPVSLMRESKNNEVMFVELRENACGNGERETSDVVISKDGDIPAFFRITQSTVPYIAVSNFVISDNVLIIDKIVAAKSSWLVVYLYDSAALNGVGENVGEYKIDPGHFSNIAVRIKAFQKGAGVQEGDELIVGLHEDNALIANEVFDDAVDVLIEETISSKFPVTFTSNMVMFKLNVQNSSSYLWSGNSLALDRIALQGNTKGDETITLTVGERYEINNPYSFFHPFELISASGEVLLSQGGNMNGIFEGDSRVDWLDKLGLMKFTLTTELADKLTQYQCINHVVAMRGDFNIIR